MKYRLMGSSGLRVSELALGAMTFGNDEWGADKDESRAVYEGFREAGGNFIDTANRYADGRSEEYLGEFLGSDRDRVVLATKYAAPIRDRDVNAVGNSRKLMMESLHASLRRLQTDYIDLYWVHFKDNTTPIDEVMRGLDDLVSQGKILYCGVSDTPAWQVARGNTIAELRGWSRFVGLQIRYSLLDRDVEFELLPMAEALDLTVTPWDALGSGVLTGKYRGDGEASGRAALRGNIPERSHAIVDAVVEVAREIGATPAQVALSWVRGGRGVIVPLVGARTRAQLDDNLGCLGVELTPEHRSRPRRRQRRPGAVPAQHDPAVPAGQRHQPPARSTLSRWPSAPGSRTTATSTKRFRFEKTEDNILLFQLHTDGGELRVGLEVARQLRRRLRRHRRRPRHQRRDLHRHRRHVHGQLRPGRPRPEVPGPPGARRREARRAGVVRAPAPPEHARHPGADDRRGQRPVQHPLRAAGDVRHRARRPTTRTSRTRPTSPADSLPATACTPSGPGPSASTGPATSSSPARSSPPQEAKEYGAVERGAPEGAADGPGLGARPLPRPAPAADPAPHPLDPRPGAQAGGGQRPGVGAVPGAVRHAELLLLPRRQGTARPGVERRPLGRAGPRRPRCRRRRS